MKRSSLLCLIVLFLGLSAPVQAAEYTGRVVGVSDGDTLTLLDESKRQVKVRLSDIDAPESRQPYGGRAKEALSEMAFNKMATVRGDETDRYGRFIGRVYVDGLDVNAEMVRRGAAWVYRKYSKDAALLELEAKAKQEMAGLWSLPEADRRPPWEWRRAKRETATPIHKAE